MSLADWFRDRVILDDTSRVPMNVLRADYTTLAKRTMAPEVFNALMAATASIVAPKAPIRREGAGDACVWFGVALNDAPRPDPIAPAHAATPTMPPVDASNPTESTTDNATPEATEADASNVTLDERALDAIKAVMAWGRPDGMPAEAHETLRAMYALEKAAIGLMVQSGDVAHDHYSANAYVFLRRDRLRPKSAPGAVCTESIPGDVLPSPAAVWNAMPAWAKPENVHIVNLESFSWKTKMSNARTNRGHVLLSGNITVRVGGAPVLYSPHDRMVAFQGETFTVADVRRGVIRQDATGAARKTRAGQAHPCIFRPAATPMPNGAPLDARPDGPGEEPVSKRARIDTSYTPTPAFGTFTASTSVADDAAWVAACIDVMRAKNVATIEVQTSRGVVKIAC